MSDKNISIQAKYNSSFTLISFWILWNGSNTCQNYIGIFYIEKINSDDRKLNRLNLTLDALVAKWVWNDFAESGNIIEKEEYDE